VRAGAFGLDLAMDVGSTAAEDRAATILDAPVLAQSDGAMEVALDPRLPLGSASA